MKIVNFLKFLGFFSGKRNDKKTPPIPVPQTPPMPKPHDAEVKIEIKPFLDTYLSAIPEDVMCYLSNMMVRGRKTAYIKEKILADVKSYHEVLEAAKTKMAEALDLCNNGMALEKSGDIEGAMRMYEEYISEPPHRPAHLPYTRLSILYSKKKDFENEKRVLLKSISVFKPLGQEKWYELRYNNLCGMYHPVYPQKSEPAVPPRPSLGEKLEAAKFKLPEFMFYSTDSEPPVLSRETLQPIWEIQRAIKSLIDEANVYYSEKRFDLAAPVFEVLVAQQCPQIAPYEKLMTIYNEAGLTDDLVRILKTGIDYFSKLRYTQYQYVDGLAKKYGKYDFWKERVSEAKKITYYNGIFELYNPYPCVEKWRKRLKKICDK